MDLEDVLGQVQTNCCNLAHGWLPLLVIFDDHHLGTSMPSGGHPPHQLAAYFGRLGSDSFSTFVASRSQYSARSIQTALFAESIAFARIRQASALNRNAVGL